MPQDKTITTNQYQIAVFPSNFYYEDVTKLKSEIGDNWPDYFDNIQLIPVPDSAPRHLPRIILKTKDNNRRCNISFNKIDFYWNNNEGNEEFYEKSVKEFKDIIKNILEPISDFKEAKRLGFVKTIYFKEENPIDFISKYVLREENKNIQYPVGKLKNYNINLTYEIDLLGDEGNNLIKLGKGKTVDDEDIVSIVSDINIPQERDEKFKLDEIHDFIDEAHQKTNKEDIFQNITDQNDE